MNTKSNNPFKVPENYFESLSSSIQQRVSAERKDSSFSIPAFATSMVAATVLLAWFFFSVEPNDANPMLLTDQEIFEVFYEEPSLISEHLLSEFWDDDLAEDEAFIDWIIEDDSFFDL
jgi:hypothetical protein